MRRRRKPACEWQDCTVPAVGYRRHWNYGTQLFTWLCRPHQRRYDKGVRHSKPSPRYEFSD